MISRISHWNNPRITRIGANLLPQGAGRTVDEHTKSKAETPKLKIKRRDAEVFDASLLATDPFPDGVVFEHWKVLAARPGKVNDGDKSGEMA